LAGARAKGASRGHSWTRRMEGRVVVKLFAEDAVKWRRRLKSAAMERYSMQRRTGELAGLVSRTMSRQNSATPPEGATLASI